MVGLKLSGLAALLLEPWAESSARGAAWLVVLIRVLLARAMATARPTREMCMEEISWEMGVPGAYRDRLCRNGKEANDSESDYYALFKRKTSRF